MDTFFAQKKAEVHHTRVFKPWEIELLFAEKAAINFI